MSVHNKYPGYTLKHLLLRHMYNLPLLVLMCYTLEPCAATALLATLLATLLMLLSTNAVRMLSTNAVTLYCVVLYILLV